MKYKDKHINIKFHIYNIEINTTCKPAAYSVLIKEKYILNIKNRSKFINHYYLRQPLSYVHFFPAFYFYLNIKIIPLEFFYFAETCYFEASSFLELLFRWSLFFYWSLLFYWSLFFQWSFFFSVVFSFTKVFSPLKRRVISTP